MSNKAWGIGIFVLLAVLLRPIFTVLIEWLGESIARRLPPRLARILGKGVYDARRDLIPKKDEELNEP
ncbi:MAG: hypothetical protein QM599_01495 [Pseudoxanthomonas sp.]